MKRYLILCFIVIISCSKPDQEQEDVKKFVSEWATAMISKDKILNRFYDPTFEFPSIILEDSANVLYTLDLDSLQIIIADSLKDLTVTVPFQVSHNFVDYSFVGNGTIILTLIKTQDGLLIRDMSQDLTKELIWRNRRLANEQEYAKQRHRYDSIWNQVRTWAEDLRKHYDSVVFFTDVDAQILFYVVKGDWVYPYLYEGAQYDSGNYKLGVVTPENKIIVPVEYSKIYNPGGSFKGMIEVEKKGKRGLFNTQGIQIAPAEFDGIYPTKAVGAVAQLKKGEHYGWVDTNGTISFDEESHKDKTLFQSPVESNSILDWRFIFPGSIKVLHDMNGNSEECAGVIVYPSFVRDLGITDVAHPWVINDVNELGMGMTDIEIKFEKSEGLAGKLYSLISFFMESGADARGYQFSQNDLIVVDSNMVKIDHLKKMTRNGYNQDPCGNLRSGPAYKVIETGLYETNDGEGNYSYYRVNVAGKVELQPTERKYAFTKFVQIDESYFKGCRYENVPYDAIENVNANVVVISGISTEELDVMRNEIFAEYGFIFKSPKWKAHFEKMPWYKPRFNNVDDQLTKIDKYNIKFILDYQRRYKDQLFKRDSISFGWAG